MKNYFKKIIAIALIATFIFPLATPAFAQSAKVQMINENKMHYITLADSVINDTNIVVSAAKLLTATDTWLEVLGTATGSTVLGFKHAVKNATDPKTLLVCMLPLAAQYTGDMAQYHANNVIELCQAPITETSGREILESIRDMQYYRALCTSICAPIVKDYAEVANKSKAEKVRHLSQKFLDAAVLGTLDGFDNWSKAVNKLKFCVEKGYSLADSILEVVEIHFECKEAKQSKENWQKKIDIYNSISNTAYSKPANSTANTTNKVTASTTVKPVEKEISISDYTFYGTLSRGSESNAVKRLRAWLNVNTGSNLDTNSRIFDKAVEDQVREFQNTRGLSLDGIVGPSTHEKLVSNYKAMQQVPVNCYVTLRNAHGSKVMDCSFDMWKMNNGITILYDKFNNPLNTGHENQVFYITHADDGAFIIHSPFQNKALQISDGNPAPYTPITVYDSSIADKNWTQCIRWYFEMTNSGCVRIVNVATQTAIDLNSNVHQNNNQFISYPINNTAAQDMAVDKV